MEVKDFCEIVFERAKKDYKEYYRKDSRNFRGNIVLGSITSILSAILLPVLGGSETMSNFPLVATVVTLSTIGGSLIYFLWLFVENLISAPGLLYFEQKEKADLYTTTGIEVMPFEPNGTDPRPAGIMVSNKKTIPIACCVKLTRYWVGKTEVKTGLPHSLAWFENELRTKNFGDTILDKSPKLIILETILSERDRSIQIEPNNFVQTMPNAVYAEIGINLELGNDLKLGVPVSQACLAEIEFEFIINGLQLRPTPLNFEVRYDGNKMMINKVDGWK